LLLLTRRFLYITRVADTEKKKNIFSRKLCSRVVRIADRSISPSSVRFR